MSASLPTIKEQAESYRYLLQAGMVDPATVEQWADALIMNEKAPDAALIDASLHKADPERMIRDLDEVAGVANRHVVRGLILQRLGELLCEKPDQWQNIIRHVEQLCADYEYDPIVFGKS